MRGLLASYATSRRKAKLLSTFHVHVAVTKENVLDGTHAGARLAVSDLFASVLFCPA